MISKYLNFSKRNRVILLILAIFMVGIFLRSFNFSQWLHFELDQERDAGLIGKAIEGGAGELPLLGPRASGSFLRLGPVFYYLEYLSALAFGNTPEGVAMVVLIFSIASLPLFLAFFRMYFSGKISLMLLALYSVSLYFVMYSRFAWNPNLLPFFILLFFYALLKTTNAKESRSRGWWLVLCALALAVVTQLHFVAFVSIPIVAVIFLAIKRPKINWRYWLASVFLIVVFYAPMAINEYKTGGDNTGEFFQAIVDKQDGDVQASIFKKMIINAIETCRYYFVMLSGVDDSQFFNLDIGKIISENENCSPRCWSNYPIGIAGAVLFLFGIFLMARGYFQEKNERKDFVFVNLLWIILTFLIFTPLVFDISPRFFLIAAFSPFFLLGLIFDYAEKNKKFYIAGIIFLFLFVSNIFALSERFSQMAKAPFENVWSKKDVILKEKRRVTLEQQKMIVEYMTKESQSNGMPLYFEADPEYANSFKYHFKKSPLLFDGISKNNIYRQGNYFLIQSINNSWEADLGKLNKSFTLSDIKQFGTLTVVRIKPKEEAITEEAQDFYKPPKKKANSKAPKRYIWREIFEEGFINEDEEDE